MLSSHVCRGILTAWLLCGWTLTQPFANTGNALFHSSIPSVIAEVDTSKEVVGAFCIGLSYWERYDSLTQKSHSCTQKVMAFFCPFPCYYWTELGFAGDCELALQGERMHLLLWEPVLLACGAQINEYSQICRKPVYFLISIISFQLIFCRSETHLCLFNMYYTFLKAIDVES